MYEVPDMSIPDPGEADFYKCPVCGEEIKESDYIYVDKAGEIIGCEHCLFEMQAYEVLKTEHEKFEDDREMWEEDRYRD